MSETHFHWIESPYRFPYLRETFVLTGRPRAKPNIGGGLLVGYGIVDNSARVGGAFRRRILYLENRDYPLNEGSIFDPSHPAFPGWPCEAVDPLSVSMGERSRNISRISRVEALQRVKIGNSYSLCGVVAQFQI